MNIYFSGIGGVGIGPLAEIALDAGYDVVGSDLVESLTTKELRERDVTVNIGQDGTFLQVQHDLHPIDWFVYTAALPDSHPELQLAEQLGIHTAKRDELLAHIIKEKQLQLIAIAGTHGKTTTTGMTVWALEKLGIPVSYSVGSTISFGPQGKFDPSSRYFVYECDEFDRNFLHFSPALSLITAVDYDHPDTYPTEADYKAAFQQFIGQSEHTILWQQDAEYLELATGNSTWQLASGEVAASHLAGAHNRRNATLVLKAVEYLGLGDDAEAAKILDEFPGTDRRFEKLAPNLYSDYGHHPSEIAATLQLAHELSDHIVLVYQPHQNRRQQELKDTYRDQFELAEEVYWLPTYLTRGDEEPILTPEELSAHLTNHESVHVGALNEDLWHVIQQAREEGKLVLAMGAGTIDSWLREKLANN